MGTMKNLFFIGAVFALKVLCSLYLLKLLSAHFLNEFGALTQYLSFLAIIFGLSLGGASNYLIKNLSQSADQEDEAYHIDTVFGYGIISSLLLCSGLLLLHPILQEHIFYNKVRLAFYIYLVISIFFSNFLAVLVAVAVAKRRYSHYFISNAIGYLSFMAIIWVALEYKLASIYWVLPLFYILPSAFLYGTLGVKIRLKVKTLFKLDKAKEIFSYCLIVYIGLTSLPLVSLFARESFRLAFGNEELSNWQAAVKISDAIQQLFGAIFSFIVLPYLSKSLNNISLIKWFKDFFLFTSFSAGAIFIFYYIADPLVSILFGESFRFIGAYLGLYLSGDLIRVCGLYCSYTFIAAGSYGKAVFFEAAQGIIFVFIFFTSIEFQKSNPTFVSYAYIATYTVCLFSMLIMMSNSFVKDHNK